MYGLSTLTKITQSNLNLCMSLVLSSIKCSIEFLDFSKDNCDGRIPQTVTVLQCCLTQASLFFQKALVP